MKTLRVVIFKPSKYARTGHVERFRWGVLPNVTIGYIQGLTPTRIGDWNIETHMIDEYLERDLRYLDLLKKHDSPTLFALVGVQSNQFHRALDLAAFARERGVENCIIGGPHAMTCDTSELQGKGVSFSLAEAELVWESVLKDAIAGELQPVYGSDRRWQPELKAPMLPAPRQEDLRRYVMPMMGVYPFRGCPFTCNFCSVIKIAGRAIRSQPVQATLDTMIAAQKAGVKMIIFTSDNFNKYPQVRELMHAMIDARMKMMFTAQCDTQISQQEDLVELMARAGCGQIFVGAESFSRSTLLAASKPQNHPERYGEIIRLCKKYRILSHFSNIVGFPSDTVESVNEHLETLLQLAPVMSMFWVLTPLPGTDQYDDFLSQGLITEKNLDRFDGQCSVWRHPTLSHKQIEQLMFDSYRRFYASRETIRNVFSYGSSLISRGDFFTPMYLAGHPLYNLYAVARRMHPIAGGVGRLYRDHVNDYMPLRRKTFGYEHVPLPTSLKLSAADSLVNSRVKMAVG